MEVEKAVLGGGVRDSGGYMCELGFQPGWCDLLDGLMPAEQA